MFFHMLWYADKNKSGMRTERRAARAGGKAAKKRAPARNGAKAAQPRSTPKGRARTASARTVMTRLPPRSIFTSASAASSK